MAFRFYIVPVIGSGAMLDSRRPKYLADGTVSVGWSAMDYGMEPWMVVGADLSVPDDATVVSKVDAFAIPFDLTQTLTAGQVTNVQAKLEAMNLPSNWVTTTRTWLYVVKAVLGIMLFMQRFNAVHLARFFTGGVSLETTYSQLPASVQTELQGAASSLGLDTTGITGASTLRVILRSVGQQLEGRAFIFGSVVL